MNSKFQWVRMLTALGHFSLLSLNPDLLIYAERRSQVMLTSHLETLRDVQARGIKDS